MDLQHLYGNETTVKKAEKRIESLKKEFLKNEGRASNYVFSSPGRCEVLGNHTDHNHGLVLVASISCDTLAVVDKNNENLVKIYSKGYDPVIVDLNQLSVKNDEYHTSNALVRGIANAITQKGYSLHGFTAYTDSNIFKGAGVSSSASFELLVSEIFNVLYLNGVLTPVEKAIISQYAENVYFNKPCGLLDQSSIAIGSLIKLDFKDVKNPIATKLNAPLGYSLVITNTGGDHASLTSHYAKIRQEMTQVANFFGKEVLREVPYKEFLSQIPALKRHFTGRAIMRCVHFYKENERVEACENALLANDYKTFLNLVNESGASSLALLQNYYVPTDEAQPVLLAVEYSKLIIKDGACRVHGGGFAGSVLAIVSDKEVDKYLLKMKKLFGNDNVFKANIRNVGATQVE